MLKKFAAPNTKHVQAIVLCLAAVGLSIFALFTFRILQHDATALDVQACSRAQSYENCLSELILDTANSQPEELDDLATAIFESANSYRDIDLRILSEPMHFAGMALAAKGKTLREAAAFCGASFKAACLHGFVMDDIENKSFNANDPERMFSYCNELKTTDYLQNLTYHNCIHGLGHELWAMTATSLTDTVALCSSLQQAAMVWRACVSGIFMEYTKGQASKGSHSHAMTGTRDLPCEMLPVTYQETCYSSVGSYRQYAPGTESFADTYSYCLALPPEYSTACSLAVSDRVLITVGGESERGIKLCSDLGNVARQRCLMDVKLLES